MWQCNLLRACTGKRSRRHMASNTTEESKIPQVVSAYADKVGSRVMCAAQGRRILEVYEHQDGKGERIYDEGKTGSDQRRSS